jgi:FkbM family methyltransferase
VPTLKHKVRTSANRLLARYDLSLERAGQLAPARRARFLRDARVDLVLDVGGATGAYVAALRETGYRGRAVSFEPLPASAAALRRRAAGDPAWEVVEVALGDAPGAAVLHVSGLADSSSLLPMLERHVQGAPGSDVVDQHEVRVAALDDLGLVGPDDRVLLKVDTQGSELAVLEGAAAALERTELLEVELSLVPLYDGAPDWMEVCSWLRRRGFTPVWVTPGFADERSGRLLQVDAIFAR